MSTILYHKLEPDIRPRIQNIIAIQNRLTGNYQDAVDTPQSVLNTITKSTHQSKGDLSSFIPKKTRSFSPIRHQIRIRITYNGTPKAAFHATKQPRVHSPTQEVKHAISEREMCLNSGIGEGNAAEKREEKGSFAGGNEAQRSQNRRKVDLGISSDLIQRIFWPEEFLGFELVPRRAQSVGLP